MPTATSRHSYSDCFDLFDKAIEDAKGIRIRCKAYGIAKQLQLRMHAARAIDRSENRQYALDHPLYGRSVYDKLKVSVHNGETIWLHVERVDMTTYEVEPLSGVPSDEPPTKPFVVTPVLEKAGVVEVVGIKRRI